MAKVENGGQAQESQKPTMNQAMEKMAYAGAQKAVNSLKQHAISIDRLNNKEKED